MQLKLLRRFPVFLASALILLISGECAKAEGVPLQAGARYKIVRPIHLMATYENLAEKAAGKGPVRAYLQPERYAQTRWVAFQRVVPAGTIMQIVGPAPAAKDLWRRYDAYYVRLEPDIAGKLDVIIQLFRGFEGASGGLNRDFFEPLRSSSDEISNE